MSGASAVSERELTALRDAARDGAKEFLGKHAAAAETYRQLITDAIEEATERLCREVAEVSAGNAVAVRLARQTREYVQWLQWTFWDLPYFAAARRPAPEAFKAGIASSGLVYLAIRIFDDIIDRHFWYKARRPTLLSAVADQHPRGEGIEGLTLLAGLLLCIEGLRRMADPAFPSPQALTAVLDACWRTVLGMILEHSERQDWTPELYERLVQLKNVDYWRCLYTAVDPDRSSPLYGFLARYYALAQHLNDVHDFAEDERRGQPNLVSLHLPRLGAAPADPPPAGAAANVPEAVEQRLSAEFFELWRSTADMPAIESAVARLKLAESLDEAFRLGLFGGAAAADGSPRPEPPEEPLGFSWFSGLGEIVERAGPLALVEVDCAVCGGTERRRLFEKQGFSLVRCAGCAHVYVAPRINLELQLRMARELEDGDRDNSFIEVQKIYAEPICHLLRLRAPGPRLLDIGFGRGYLMQLARAYGFEVYGFDSSRLLVEQLVPEFGQRLHLAAAGAEEVPWSNFDVIVMSHVVEHLADPAAVLADVRARLNPGGLLYVAVPDMESLQFRVFGKHWDVVNPLVHFQYFAEAPLSRLLTGCGFVGLERITLPPLPQSLTPRWARLLRKLGGNESGELAMLAQRPEDEAAAPATPAAL